jgi:hypothetical protein
MSTADLEAIVNGVVDLAAIGVLGGLIYTRRIVFAATPKAPVPPRNEDAAPPAVTEPEAGRTS